MKAVQNIGGLVAACACALGAAALGCASAPRAEPVSTTTTTAAEPGYTPGEVQLYVARNSGASQACSPSLTPDVDFAPRTADPQPGELATLDAWARCLNLPELAQTTIVLLGGNDVDGPADLFMQRAERVREALVARGIDPQRIVVGATNATREGGPYASKSGVRLETTHATTVRSFPPQNKLARYGVR